ncbi:MAG: hypothetical protein sL5_10000 [Candidatus Mesenet longicola]|uniref:Uncharacterized protein n=1 Tax=Candidatus Mesenet longicola TaxID=1892558 RepID=A0A8J3HVF2_9RICK|nr:MAG: hypothetical protein sGL2_10410 [Candidatus Mesenet longicola]GHM60007.1 MAG: hypothetical protein sL5_10000 [Candidatus Mesenet longicola]
MSQGLKRATDRKKEGGKINNACSLMSLEYLR